MKNPLTIYRNMAREARTALWFIICNFLQRGTALITVPVFTRLLTEEQYGICNVYFSWFDILVLFTSLNLPYEGFNNGLIRYEDDKDGYASATSGLILTMTIVWIAGYLLLFRNTTLLSVMMMMQLLWNPGLYLWINRERFDFRYKKPVIVSIISTIASVCISIFVVMHTELKAEARIMATVLVQSVFGLMAYIILLKRGRIFIHKKYWLFALKFNLPLLLYYLAQIVLNQSDRIMISHYAGNGKAGIYSVAYTAASISLLLVSAVNGSFNPWLYRKLKSGVFNAIRKISSMLMLLVAAAVLGLCIIAPDLIRILAAAGYQEAVYIVPPVAVSVFFIFLYMLFANIEMYYGSNRYVAVASVAAAVCNMILNAVAIPLYGYMAAGWTTLICYVFHAMMHYVNYYRICRSHKLLGSMYNVRFIFLLSLIVIGLGMFMPWVYSLGIWRYLLLFAMILIAGITWRYRK